MSLIRTVYVSAAAKPFTQPELRDLLSKARIHNTSKDITGLLLYHQQSFFQILEGEEDEVRSLFIRIERDARHNRVLLLSKKDVDERNFGGWSMGFIDMELTAAKLPGFMKLMHAKSSFLDLQGDSKVVTKLIDGFQEGQWRQSIDR
jgi:Sensors of blue-light using FAD